MTYSEMVQGRSCENSLFNLKKDIEKMTYKIDEIDSKISIEYEKINIIREKIIALENEKSAIRTKILVADEQRTIIGENLLFHF